MSSVLVFFHDAIRRFLKQKQNDVWNPQGQPANRISPGILNASGRYIRDVSIISVHIHRPLSNITGIHVPPLLLCPPRPMPNQNAWYQCYQQAPTARKHGMANSEVISSVNLDCPTRGDYFLDSSFLSSSACRKCACTWAYVICGETSPSWLSAVMSINGYLAVPAASVELLCCVFPAGQRQMFETLGATRSDEGIFSINSKHLKSADAPDGKTWK